MKLIDLDALGVGMANPAMFENRAHADGWNSLYSILQTAPVVDTEPVAHGRWVRDEMNYEYTCSGCKCNIDYSTMYGLVDHGYEYASYCPNCGAKMDGGAEDES